MTDESISLNPSHHRRLSVTCRHVDKLLADMESALNGSTSRLAFPQYVHDVSPGQRRVIEDYIGRIRAQLVRVLDGQGIDRPPADIPVSRSLHSYITFVTIAAEELKPEYMRGYGEMPAAAAVELSGIASELQGLVRQLDHYLIRGAGENLADRLARLEQAGDEILSLKKLESAISEHGLVEFRSSLSMILDRLEDNSFEIAIFGRVSSGKSSLLNAMLETDVLPVGVTPITAVPTRLVYGDSPAIHVWFANREPERFEISQLAEFVSEQLNPGNQKQVSRIALQIPSSRLRQGIVFVDTPGLGSLATRGAAETLAYLPRCDLGVVLIDAGSTLTHDDLRTIQILYDAAIPATVLLSKADLLTPADRNHVISYVRDHIKEELNLDLRVGTVSVMTGSRDLLTQWFEEDVAPLYDHQQELRLQSMRRKAAALRQSVEMALRSRLHRKNQISPKKIERLRVVEAELRQASGRLEEMKKLARRVANDLQYSSISILRFAAAALIESWSKVGEPGAAPPAIVRNAAVYSVQEQTDSLRRQLAATSRKLYETIRAAARTLEIADVPGEQEFSGFVRELPTFDPGPLKVNLKRPFFFGLLGKNHSLALLSSRLARTLGPQLEKSLSAYHALLYDWSERTMSQIQRRFDAYANSYRAQVNRLLGMTDAHAIDESAIQRDLENLGNSHSEQIASSMERL